MAAETWIRSSEGAEYRGRDSCKKRDSAFPFQSVLTVHAGIEMSAKIFELLLAQVVVQIAQQVDVEVITGLHRFDPRRQS